MHRACLLATVVLADRLRNCEKWLQVAGTPAEAKALGRSMQLSVPWRVGRQFGADLGMRMQAAIAQRLNEGAKKVVVVGTDTPWMGRARIERALAQLEDHDVVLGPAEDGGYYLVGARKVVREMFSGLPWGTDRVLPRTILALKRARVRYSLLPEDFDLDRPADLLRAALLLHQEPSRAKELADWIWRWLGAGK